MSQRIVYDLLQSLGGEATISELNQAAKREYPSRSVESYTNKRLKSLKRKGVVERYDADGETVWKILDTEPITVFLTQIDERASEKEVTSAGLNITNIVATADLDAKFDLYRLNEYMQNTTYEPETSSTLIHRMSNSSSITFMIPSSGRVTIVGAKNKEDLLSALQHLNLEVERAGYEVDCDPDGIIVRNVVANGSLGQEVDLAQLVVYLGMENTEYDPESFPGMVYRLGSHTLILFRSGKYVITGQGDYESIMETNRAFSQNLPSEISSKTRN